MGGPGSRARSPTPVATTDVQVPAAAYPDLDSRPPRHQPGPLHRAGPGPGGSVRGARHQPQRARRGAREPPHPVWPRRPRRRALRPLGQVHAQGRLGLFLREPGQCLHPHHAAAAHHPLRAGDGAASGPPRRAARRCPFRRAPLLHLRPDRHDLRLHRLLAAHVLHRPPLHPLLQHLSRLAALHLSRGHQRHGLAMGLGNGAPGHHAHRRPRALPGRDHRQARGPQRPHPRGDPGGPPDPGYLHGRRHHRADLPRARYRLAAHQRHPLQRHAGDHGHHLRLFGARRALQPDRGPGLRLAGSADLDPLTTMANGTASPAVLTRAQVMGRRPAESLTAEAWRRFRRHRLATFGAVMLGIMVLAVLLGPIIYRVPINEIDFKAKLKTPSWAHPMGTDDLGQDVLARMLYGGRISLAVGVAAMLIAITVGTAVGAVSGQAGGVVDHALMRVTDLFLALPQLPLLLLIIYLFRDTLKKVLGPEAGVFVMIVVVIGGLRWMPVARLVRAQFLSLREKEFVEAARSLGAPPLRQVIRHILPNALGPVIVAGSLDVAAAILAESTLSFLGLGFPPDIPTWGRILFDAKDNLDFAPHWAIFPGTAIFLTVLSINYLGDGLRDALDPRKVL